MAVRITVKPGAETRILNKPAMRRRSHRAAERVADNVRAQGIKVGDRNGGPDEIPLPVGVFDKEGEGGKPVSVVVIPHPSGAAVQAKHGALTKAAGQAGMRLR